MLLDGYVNCYKSLIETFTAFKCFHVEHYCRCVWFAIYVYLQSRVPSGSSEPKLRVYDAEHERRRKDQLNKLFHRTTEQVYQWLLSQTQRITTLHRLTVYSIARCI